MKRSTHLMALVASFALVTGSTAGDRRHPPRQPTRLTARVGSRSSSRPSSFVRTTVRPMGRAQSSSGKRTTPFVPTIGRRHGQGAITLEQLPGSGQVPVIGSDGSSAVRVDGFDWVDAAIGAAAALGLGLIVAGGVVVALRRAHAPAYS